MWSYRGEIVPRQQWAAWASSPFFSYSLRSFFDRHLACPHEKPGRCERGTRLVGTPFVRNPPPLRPDSPETTET